MSKPASERKWNSVNGCRRVMRTRARIRAEEGRKEYLQYQRRKDRRVLRVGMR